MPSTAASQKKTISILMVDDHEMVRDTIAYYLREAGDMDVSTASDLTEALATIESKGAFDVVLLDFIMPDMDGFEGLKKAIVANAPNPVAILTGALPGEMADRAIELGAKGFIRKSLSAKSLVNVIRFIAAGDEFVQPSTTRVVQAGTASSPAPLTMQELRVLRSLSEGKTNKEIARELDRKEVTVKMYVRAICAKLRAKNRTHAALLARSANII